MNREEAQQRVDELANRFQWDKEKRRKFHDHLRKYHWDTKDDLEFSELLQIAKDF